jgi:5-methylcytosine-specific restriction endonuclease McrA
MAPAHMPSAEYQLTFLANIQRLFSEGESNSTYKFALIMTLADLAVERGTERSSPLPLDVREIADRFIQLYWRQGHLYKSGHRGTEEGVLIQRHGSQASIVSAISKFQIKAGPVSISNARAHPEYTTLVRFVTRVVGAKPLVHLQNFGGKEHEFIFVRSRGVVTLKEGVAFCMRRFHVLIHSLARSAWIAHVKANRLNLTILGQTDDLHSFLFGAPRRCLSEIARSLRTVDGSVCFYCQEPAQHLDVDHFIPWALYPRDYIHNFVLAHKGCNSSKGAMLAAGLHLERWLWRIEESGDALSEIATQVGVMSDRAMSVRVARWAYSGVFISGGSAWLRNRNFDSVNHSYIAKFTAER